MGRNSDAKTNPRHRIQIDVYAPVAMHITRSWLRSLTWVHLQRQCITADAG